MSSLRERAEARIACSVGPDTDLIRELLEEVKRLRHDLFGGDMALSNIYDRQEADIARLHARVAELEEGIKTVVPYVVATLPRRERTGGDEWGPAHLGRSDSSIRQLNNLLAKATTTAPTPGADKED